MKKLDDQNIDICSISDDDADHDHFGGETPTPRGAIMQMSESNPNNSGCSSASSQRPNKLMRQRASVNQTKSKDSDTNLMETSLMILNPPPSQRKQQSSYSLIAGGSSNIFESTTPPSTPPQPQESPLQLHHPFSLAAASEASPPHSQIMPSVRLPSQHQTLIQPSVHQHQPSSSKPIEHVPPVFAQLSPPPTTSSLSSLWQPHSTSLLQPAAPVHQLLVPPAQNSEPELVLSPAKLGQ